MTSRQGDSRPRAAWAVVVVCAIASLAAVVWCLAGMMIDRTPIPEAGQSNLRNLWPFWIASAASWAALTALWMLLRRTAPGARPARLARPVLLILTVAVSARVAVLFTHEPALSDDVYRYVFDGRNTAAGFNPYLETPAQRMGVDVHAVSDQDVEDLLALFNADELDEHWPGEAQLLPLINNKVLPTLYLPASQWVFAAAGVAIIDGWSDPDASARLFRAVFIAFDLAVIVGLLIALGKAGKSPWWVALYAWHPLPLAEIAGSGHQESLGIALLVAALLFGAGVPQRAWRWSGLLALAVLIKPMVLPVAPLVLKGQAWRAWARSLAIGAGVCLLVAGPLLLTYDAQPLKNVLSTAERFTLKWAHFGGIYEPLLWAAERAEPQWTNDQQEVLARRICGAMVAVIILGVWLRRSRSDVWAGARMILFAMVLLSPTAQPWYLLWVLALAPMAMSPAVWVASLTLPWGYAVLGDVVDWSVPSWVMAAAYGPVYAALLFDVSRSVRARGGAAHGPEDRR